jgi:hypothetical protein
MPTPISSLQVIELTCGHCGCQNRMTRQGLNDSQLYELESRACVECGNKGMVVVLTSYATAKRSDIENRST